MRKIFEFNEYTLYNSISDIELMEMANVSPRKTGIQDVYIWFGPNPHYHGKRIKVSNIPNKFSKEDCFTITIPDFKIIGDINKKLIDSNKLDKIKELINKNIKIIEDFSDELISTDEFIDKLQSV
jgi:hypothetical protein